MFTRPLHHIHKDISDSGVYGVFTEMTVPVIPQGLRGFDTDPTCWGIAVFLYHLKPEKNKSLKWGDTTLRGRFSASDVEVWFVCQLLLTVICHTDGF